MVSMVATSSLLLPTLHPHLTLKGSLSPNPSSSDKSFLDLKKTPSFPMRLEIQYSRVLLAPIMTASARRELSNRATVENQSDLVSIEETSENKKFLMKFGESIMSFAFGDGNPNKGVHEEKRWKSIKQCIASKNGIVAAEELAPYLDGFETNDEEKHMSQVLKRFNGSPQVDEFGNILYVFESLQNHEEKVLHDHDHVESKIFIERKWKFSKIGYFERVKVLLFGFVLRDVLSYLTKEWLLMQQGSTKLWASVMLQVSVISVFMLIPLLRFMVFCFVFVYKNCGVEKRNRARKRAAEALECPDLMLRQKMANAKKRAGDVKERMMFLYNV